MAGRQGRQSVKELGEMPIPEFYAYFRALQWCFAQENKKGGPNALDIEDGG